MNAQTLSYAIIDFKSKILTQNQAFNDLFHCNEFLYDAAPLRPFQDVLLKQDKVVLATHEPVRAVLINVLDQNVVLNKYPTAIYEQEVGIQITSETLSISPLKKLFLKDSPIHPEVREKNLVLKNYSNFQQEIIFCLLLGLRSDKSIANYIENRKKINISDKSIRNAINSIFLKLCTNDRDSLTSICLHLNFDQNIPDSLFGKKIYDLDEILAS